MKVDDLLVFHCAPTMAGIKMANLISLPVTEKDMLYHDMVKEYNDRFNSKGLYFRTLCSCRGRHLLLLYRQDLLMESLTRPEVRIFLKACGYHSLASLEEMLTRLSFRLRGCQEFPHEIGIFLGYPLEDVQSFIKEKGANSILCGEWKVYHNVDAAKCAFAQYAKCRQSYVDLYQRGYDMEYLVIA